VPNADSGTDIVPVSVPDSVSGTLGPTLDWKVYKGHERLVVSREGEDVVKDSREDVVKDSREDVVKDGQTGDVDDGGQERVSYTAL
jgi:hypothetical protein